MAAVSLTNPIVISFCDFLWNPLLVWRATRRFPICVRSLTNDFPAMQNWICALPGTRNLLFNFRLLVRTCSTTVTQSLVHQATARTFPEAFTERLYGVS